MRTLKLIILALMLIAVVLLALANRELVTLQLLPDELSGIAAASVDLPLFLVILLSIATGMILGYILEWLREHRHRRRAAEKEREAARLRSEIEQLRRQRGPEDDVLALVG